MHCTLFNYLGYCPAIFLLLIYSLSPSPTEITLLVTFFFFLSFKESFETWFTVNNVFLSVVSVQDKYQDDWAKESMVHIFYNHGEYWLVLSITGFVCFSHGSVNFCFKCFKSLVKMHTSLGLCCLLDEVEL